MGNSFFLAATSSGLFFLIAEDTTKIVDSYIDGVDTDLDKDRIKVQMRELMLEAQSLEVA